MGPFRVESFRDMLVVQWFCENREKKKEGWHGEEDHTNNNSWNESDVGSPHVHSLFSEDGVGRRHDTSSRPTVTGRTESDDSRS